MKNKLITRSSFTTLEKIKINFDLKIASALSSRLHNDRYIVVLDGGYGVDAVTSGNVTRFHYDMDLIVVHNNYNIRALMKTVLNILQSVDRNSNWVINKSPSGWIWITGNSQESYSMKKQLNIHLMRLVKKNNSKSYLIIKSRKGMKYKMNVVKSSIKDLDGKDHKFYTLPHEEYAAAKLRLIPHYAPRWNIREIDVYDFSLLFDPNSIDIQNFIYILTAFYMGKQQKDGVQKYIYSPRLLLSKLLKRYPSIMSLDQKNEIKEMINFR